MRIEWSDGSLEDLALIYRHIAQRSPRTASETVARIRARTRKLVVFPGSGRAVPEFDSDLYREVIEPPFRIQYLIAGDIVRIITVAHGAMNLAEEE